MLASFKSRFVVSFLPYRKMKIIFLFLFKSRFYYHSGMVRPIDQEMIAIEINKMVLIVPKRKGHGTPSRSHGGSPEAIRGHVGKAFIVE